MTASTEDLARRVERLERRLGGREMEERLAGDEDAVHRFWRRIPFGAWLKLSGPTFAVMALGFGLLWNAQQETMQRILEVEQSTTEGILEVHRSTTERILDVQQATTDRILHLQRSTTDRILEMQQQVLDLHRESRAGSG